MKDKKAILGIDTVKIFLISLLAVAIIGIASLIVFDAIDDVNTSSRTTYLANSSTWSMNDNETAYAVATTSNCILTVTGLVNSTGGVTIASGNYTVSGCTLVTAGKISAGVNNSIWKITGYYTDNEDQKTISRNLSQGTVGFFGNIPTFFTLLAVVIVILIISIVIIAVNRFGAGGGGIVSGSGDQSANL